MRTTNEGKRRRPPPTALRAVQVYEDTSLDNTVLNLQGYLTYKKTHPLRTLP